MKNRLIKALDDIDDLERTVDILTNQIAFERVNNSENSEKVDERIESLYDIISAKEIQLEIFENKTITDLNLANEMIKDFQSKFNSLNKENAEKTNVISNLKERLKSSSSQLDQAGSLIIDLNKTVEKKDKLFLDTKNELMTDAAVLAQDLDQAHENNKVLEEKIKNLTNLNDNLKGTNKLLRNKLDNITPKAIPK